MEETKPFVTVLIPAYNESKSIQSTVEAVKSVGKVDQVIVVNDCSADNTSELAKTAGAEVFDLPHNLGKGGALNYGLQYAKGDVIALIDGDLGKTAVDVEKLLDPVLNNQADMTIAKFSPTQKKGGFGMVTHLARKGIRLYTGLEVACPLSGQRALTREVLGKIGATPFESGFGVEVGLTIDVFRHGFRVREIPVQMSHAETGRDLAGFLHRGQQFAHVLLVLANRLLKR
jgi:glycosyltransferase involved in cell wall biosynthesis